MEHDASSNLRALHNSNSQMMLKWVSFLWPQAWHVNKLKFRNLWVIFCPDISGCSLQESPWTHCLSENQVRRQNFCRNSGQRPLRVTFPRLKFVPAIELFAEQCKTLTKKNLQKVELMKRKSSKAKCVVAKHLNWVHINVQESSRRSVGLPHPNKEVVKFTYI